MLWNTNSSSISEHQQKTNINNNLIFSKTTSLELYNKSTTKVYKVLVQISDNGKISYSEYDIEPTETITLGCDSNFKVNNYNKEKFNSTYGECVEAITLSNLSKNKIKYNIHKVQLISIY